MCLTKECVQAYLDKLEKGIHEYMDMPIGTRSAEAVESMVRCWQLVNALSEAIEETKQPSVMTEEDAVAWNHAMRNADGTLHGHWHINETAGLDKPRTMSDWEWNAAMNMMYSDYVDVATKYGVNTPGFFADMAKAFVCDEDAKPDKLARYYKHIVM